jgi:hypothetical protein
VVQKTLEEPVDSEMILLPACRQTGLSNHDFNNYHVTLRHAQGDNIILVMVSLSNHDVDKITYVILRQAQDDIQCPNFAAQEFVLTDYTDSHRMICANQCNL